MCNLPSIRGGDDNHAACQAQSRPIARQLASLQAKSCRRYEAVLHGMEGPPVVLAGDGMPVTNGVKIGITYVLFTFEASGYLLHADGEVYYLLLRCVYLYFRGVR